MADTPFHIQEDEFVPVTDECLSAPCDTNALCDSTGGGLTCTCDIGYTGDGFTCTGKQVETTDPSMVIYP